MIVPSGTNHKQHCAECDENITGFLYECAPCSKAYCQNCCEQDAHPLVCYTRPKADYAEESKQEPVAKEPSYEERLALVSLSEGERQQMLQLQAMEFANFDDNLTALRRNCGDIEEAIACLLEP